MDNNVIISIKGLQSYNDMEDQEIELVTEGKLIRGDKGFQLLYEESPLTGLEGTLTTFDVTEGSITLTRTGPLTSQMVFEEGKKHYSMYSTEYGSFTVGIAAARVEHSLNDKGGEIAIDYSIEVDHALTGSNSFRINIKNTDNNLKS